MYKVTCCRIGTFPEVNRKGKGAFTKEFNNIEELVGFFVYNRDWVCATNLRKEISKQDMRVLNIKYRALLNFIERKKTLLKQH